MTLSGEYFDALYEAHDDPWGLNSRWYEQRKYDLTVACLPRPRYRNAFEPGCSIGVLTTRLAPRCDNLLAMDISRASLERASDRGLPPSVRLRQGALPHDWPIEVFDLIVFSEVGYYFSPADLDVVISHAQHSLSADGHLIAVHWRQKVADYPLSGEEVHQTLETTTGLHGIAQYRDEFVVLDVFAAGAGGRLTAPE
jgi:cyclopropane fatty-acyl-phospholipid synthase-like methyltransferase